MTPDARRERLARRLLAARDARAARSIVRAHATECVPTLSWDLLKAFAPLLRRSPRKAGRAVVALRAVAAESGDEQCAAHAATACGAAAFFAGRLAEARHAYREAARLHARAGRSVLAGDAWTALVEIEKESGRRRAALAAHARAEAAYGDDADPRRLGALRMNLGNAHHQADAHDEALRAYASARRLFARAGDVLGLGMCDHNTANILATLDRTDEARRSYEAALAAFRAASHDTRAAAAEYALAGLDVLEGSLDEGLERLSLVRDRRESLGDVTGVAHAELDAADALLRLNRPAEAEPLARRARTRFRRAGQAQEAATCDVILAGAALQEGRPAAALGRFQSAMALRRRSGNEVAAATAAIGLAAAELKLDRLRAASGHALRAAATLAGKGLRARAARALTIASAARLASGDEPHARRLASRARILARGRDLHAEMAATLSSARCASARGDAAAEHALLLQAADLVDRMRIGVTSEESLLSFALDKSEVFERLVANRLRAGTKEAAREALHHAERGKARVLAERLARGGRGIPRTPATRAALARLAALDRRLAVAESRLAGNDASPGLRSRREAEAVRLVTERARLVAGLQRTDPGAALASGGPSADPAAGIATLGQGELALEYAESEGHLHLFAVERGSVEAFPSIARMSDVRDLVDRLRFHLGKGVLGPGHAERHAEFLDAAARRRLGALFDVLLAPVASRLDGRAIRIIPHGVLHGLPFHALERDGTPLVERSTVSQAPSLAVLGLIRRHATAAVAPPLVLGVPDAAAPAIEAEVAAIRRHAPSATVLRGSGATGSALRESAGRPSVLHVACHGFFSDAGNESHAALRLGDAWLTLPEIHALGGTGRLVVLSGCDTGRGTVHAGDEWLGLVRGFLVAGASCVVASLWQVHDESTVQLMDDFYSHLHAGRSVGDALAESQRAARRRGEPLLHWAPFVAVGDPTLRLDLRRVA